MPVHLQPSKSIEWGTPPELVRYLADRYARGAFDLDVAASDLLHVAPVYYARDGLCGLEHPWWGRVFCNPPYGWREEKAWVSKAVNERGNPHVEVVVMLLPAKTDSAWWHSHVEHDVTVKREFLKGRLRFVGASGSAPFPSVVLVL
jgi:phage N-6-adenine-methyltransferase